MKLLIGIRMKALFGAMKKSFGGKKGMGALIAVAIVFLFLTIVGGLVGRWSMVSS